MGYSRERTTVDVTDTSTDCIKLLAVYFMQLWVGDLLMSFNGTEDSIRQDQPNTGIDRRPSLLLLERAEPFRTGHRTREGRGEQGSF